MRLLVILVVLPIGLAVFQSYRNPCYWHGWSQAVDWVACLSKV